ncbi:hypothetical protein [[Eubacterium] cellulosolvens]
MKSAVKLILVTVFIISLMFSTQSVILQQALATQPAIYDFKDIINNEAFEGSDSSQPPATLEVGSGLSSENLDKIASSDNQRALFYGDDSDYHRFKFKIFQPSFSISQLYVEHEGYGIGPESQPETAIRGLKLFIWNYDTASWEFLDDHDIGDADTITSATITQNIENYIDNDGFLNLLAQAKENAGSCPFLFTYDGDRYVFVADLYNRGILAVPNFPPQPEDYAKIDTEKLDSDDGFYKIQITQEYDEISYLDKTNLITIDHSPEVEVFPSLLKTEVGKIYTISKSLSTPISAIDENGKDVKSLIAEEDGVYTAGKQYVLDLLELDLGDLSNVPEIKLVITGYTNWDNDEILRPVQTSKSIERFVQVKDTNNDWVTVYENFELITPSALPRTYVLNLTGKFITDDYSVRIGFYPDVKFDYVGIDKSQQQDITITNLPPVYAGLHFRGYSEMNGFPEMPKYNIVSSNPPSGYSNPAGSFTKFGDVLPLISDRDDKYVVLRHGDEISVQFDYLPIENGMERDFQLYSYGYYKGRDYPTGTTVDPLPFYGMSGYPYPAGESYPYDDEHNAYLNEYNTRVYERSNSNLETEEHHTIYTDYVKVEVNSPAVGGIVMPINTVKILMPYLALAGIITLVLMGLMIKRKRE